MVDPLDSDCPAFTAAYWSVDGEFGYEEGVGVVEFFDRGDGFWQRGFAGDTLNVAWALRALLPYDPARTLLIDDSLPVLRAARQGSIAHLLSVYRPDTRQPDKDVGEFPALRHFAEIMPG